MNDIYVHTSDLHVTKYLRDNPYFKAPYDIPFQEASKMHRNEYGYLDCDGLRVHILIGRMTDSKCIWCESEIKFNYKKKEKSDLYNEYILWMSCEMCGSTGPKTVLNINTFSVMDSLEAFIRFKYTEYIPWDKNLKSEWMEGYEDHR